MAFSNDDDIEIRVTLDPSGAVRGLDTVRASTDAVRASMDKWQAAIDRTAAAQKPFDGVRASSDTARTATDKLLKSIEKGQVAFEKLSRAERQLEGEMGRLAAASQKAASFDPFSKLSKQFEQAFAGRGKQSAERFADTLFSIGEAARKAGVPMDEVTRRLEATGRASEQSAKVVEQSGSAFSRFGAAVVVANQTLGLIDNVFRGVIATAGQFGRALDEAGRIEGITASFQTLQRSVGQVADESLARLRTATRGTVSDLDLMQKANQAVLLGLPAKGFDQMAASAVKLGRAMGLDAAGAVDALTLGIGRQSRLILDNLGIIVSADQAYQRWADTHGVLVSEMSDAQRRLAFTEEAMRKINSSAKDAADINDTAAVSYQQLSAAADRLWQQFLDGINRSKDLGDGLREVKAGADDLQRSGALARIGDAVGTLAGKFLTLAGTLMSTKKVLATFDESTPAWVRGDAPSPAPSAPADPLADLFPDSLTNATRRGPGDAREQEKIARDAADAQAQLNAKLQETARTLQGELGEQALPGVTEKMKTLFAEVKSGKTPFDQILPRLKEFATLDLAGNKGAQELLFKNITRALADFNKEAEDGKSKAKQFADQWEKTLQRLSARGGTDPLPALAPRVDAAVRAANPLPGKGASDGGAALVKLGEEYSKTGGAAEKFAAQVQVSEDRLRDLARAANDDAKLKQQETDQISDLIKEYEKLIGRVLEYNEARKIANDPAEQQRVAGKVSESQQPGFLSDAQRNASGNVDLAKLFGGQDAGGGGFFGFDLGTGNKDLEGQFASIFSSAIQNGFSQAASGTTLKSEDWGKLSGSLAGQAAAQAANAYAPGSGVVVGPLVDQFVQGMFHAFSKKSSLRKGQEAVDKFFSEVLKDHPIKVGDKVVFDFTIRGAENGQIFAGLPEEARQSFDAVGAVVAEYTDKFEEMGGLAGAAIAENLGGNLEKLQQLVEATGMSFDEFGEQIVKAMYKGELSIVQAQVKLERLRNLFSPGIVGEIGAVGKAWDNFQQALKDDDAAAAINAFGDIAAEAVERGITTYDQLREFLVNTYHASAEDVDQFIKGATAAGAKSFADYIKFINDAKTKTNFAIATAANVEEQQQGGQPTHTVVIDPTVPATPRSSGGGSGRDLKKEAEQARKDFFSQVSQMVQGSEEYAAIIRSMKAGVLDHVHGQELINRLYGQAEPLIKKLVAAQKEYDKAIASGKAERIRDTAETVASLKRQIEEFGKFQMTLGALAKSKAFGGLLKNPLSASVAGQVAGVTLEDANKATLDKFLSGQLDAGATRRELDSNKGLLSAGIAGKDGAVDEAFKNFLKTGTKGGAVTLNALRGIGVEAQELFLKNQSPARLQEFQDLKKAFNEAKGAYDGATRADGETTAQFEQRRSDLKDRLEGAKKRLDDFSATLPKINLQDFRSQLEQSFDPEVVNRFFTAMHDGGIDTFDQFAQAGDAALVNVIARADELQLPFEKTNQEVTDLLDRLERLKNTVTEHEVKVKVTGSDQQSADWLDRMYNRDSGVGQGNPSSSKGGSRGLTYKRLAAGIYQGSDNRRYQKVGSRYIPL